MVVLVGYGDADYGGVETGADVDGDGDASAGDGEYIVACKSMVGYGVESGAGLKFIDF